MLKVRSVLLNSKAAIDLASIMVGIIVIGLIGGVIAATVFAVIPWVQDNAAKEQLQSIHTAQNAAYGLSADPSRPLLPGQQRNSYTNSVGLDSSSYGMLVQGDTYCTVPTANGQDYVAYALSASGKLWKASNSEKEAVTVANIDTEVGLADLGCVRVAENMEGAPVNPDEGSNPPEPVPAEPTLVKHFTWEPNTDLTGMTAERYNLTYNTNPKAYEGNYTGRLGTFNRAYNGYDFVVGDKYRISGWIYGDSSTWANDFRIYNNHESSKRFNFGVKGQWTFISHEWTATHKTQNMIFTTQRGYWYMDDFKLEKL